MLAAGRFGEMNEELVTHEKEEEEEPEIRRVKSGAESMRKINSARNKQNTKGNTRVVRKGDVNNHNKTKEKRGGDVVEFPSRVADD
jgi:hypothetical protein